MPTEITPEFLERVGFAPSGNGRPARWFNRVHETCGVLHINVESGNCVLQTDVDEMSIGIGGAQERLRAAWFMLTGQHLPYADPPTAGETLMVLDGVEMGDPAAVRLLPAVVPVLREAVAYATSWRTPAEFRQYRQNIWVRSGDVLPLPRTID